jgi:hypothetical protein
MKRVLIVALALLGFSAASLAQTVPATKKNEPSKTQIVKKATRKKENSQAVASNKAAKTTTPAVAKTQVAKAKPVAEKTVAKTNAAGPLKKDGTPDMRFKSNHAIAAGPLKKEGTPDRHFKTNKKHT